MNHYKNVALHHSVIVNLTTGRAFRGVLLQTNKELLILANAELIEAGEQPIPVSGNVVIERSRVEFVQVVK